ncbi:MAG TPA: hypothetical protein VF898_00175 [Chloroflexota bacterium]
MDFIDVEIMRRLLPHSYPVGIDVLYGAFGASDLEVQKGLDDAVQRLTQRKLVKVDHGTLWLTLAGRMVAQHLVPPSDMFRPFQQARVS